MSLASSLHKSFYQHLWKINPQSLEIEIREEVLINLTDKKMECIKYNKKKLKIKPSNKMLNNLLDRYKLFKNRLSYV